MGKSALAAEAIWILSPGPEPPDRFPDGIFFHTFYHQPQAGQGAGEHRPRLWRRPAPQPP